jgi:hypothetical protein
VRVVIVATAANVVVKAVIAVAVQCDAEPVAAELEPEAGHSGTHNVTISNHASQPADHSGEHQTQG